MPGARRPSGAGKTSILRVVAGLLRPERGRGALRRRDVARHRRAASTSPPERRRCGYLFQEYALFPHLSAWQNVAYPLRELPRGERRGARARAARALRDGAPRRRPAGARCPAASASAWRWRARSRAGPTCCCSTSRCRRSTRARARAPARELGAVLREARGAGPARDPRLRRGGAARRPGRGDRRRPRRPGGHPERARGRAAARRSWPTSPAPSCSPGSASAGPDGLTRVALDGGGEVVSTDARSGPVAASVFPWEIAIEPAGRAEPHRARRRTASRPRSHRSRESATACAWVSAARPAARGGGHAGVHAPAGAGRGRRA